MGIYMRLDIIPEYINPDEWKEVYLESLQLLKAYPFVRLIEESVNGIPRLIYCNNPEENLDDEYQRHWRVSGDSETKKTGETFDLYYDLNRYLRSTNSVNAMDKDIIFEKLKEENAVRTAFDSKTQGHDYHTYILAIAMLIESRFPYAAVVGGDFDILQAEIAKKWANNILAKPIDIPVRVDAEKLVQRLSIQLSGVEAIEAFNNLYLPGHDNARMHQVIVDEYGIGPIKKWFTQQLLGYNSPCQLGAISLFIEWLNTTQDFAGLCEIICGMENNNEQIFGTIEFIKAICSTWVLIPPEWYKFMNVLKYPQGVTLSIAGQFGGIFLDMYFSGRHIEFYMSREKIVEVLIRYFDVCPEVIEQIINERVEEIKQALSGLREKLSPIFESLEIEEDIIDDEELYLYYSKETVLPDNKKIYLTALARKLENTLNESKNVIAVELLADMHKGIEIMAYSHGIALTEEAWNRIDHEQNEDVLKLLFSFLVISSDSKSFYNLRKAVLENNLLCHKISELIKDRELVKKAEE
ncbi:hypothetical protein Dtox_4002 [Desulfofarcimen acetoxidans DSM 771]|uniref:Uncharacterized protein n=1 Tax=Desulfofarcimen acetoxidans (strain ATCC 49208 / DSM 771 / KCTC 5769 / VKM B-1644 / 5575) TaxID=485916 RepID=C8VY62_DESAS|nr:hypothetical protein [Desulfofarcimen acetoxidans]ACV64691.1 hypothetical protein Dtox_4002 [Desulfofarcimen acetoxidans DSM 771]